MSFSRCLLYITSVMVHSHWTEQGTRTRPGPGLMGINVLCRNVHTIPWLMVQSHCMGKWRDWYRERDWHNKKNRSWSLSLSLTQTSVNISTCHVTWYYIFHLVPVLVPVPYPCEYTISLAGCLRLWWKTTFCTVVMKLCCLPSVIFFRRRLLLGTRSSQIVSGEKTPESLYQLVHSDITCTM